MPALISRGPEVPVILSLPSWKEALTPATAFSFWTSESILLFKSIVTSPAVPFTVILPRSPTGSDPDNRLSPAPNPRLAANPLVKLSAVKPTLCSADVNTTISVPGTAGFSLVVNRTASIPNFRSSCELIASKTLCEVSYLLFPVFPSSVISTSFPSTWNTSFSSFPLFNTLLTSSKPIAVLPVSSFEKREDWTPVASTPNIEVSRVP